MYMYLYMNVYYPSYTMYALVLYAAVFGANISAPRPLEEHMVPPVHAQHRLEGGRAQDWLSDKGRDSVPVPHSHTHQTQT